MASIRAISRNLLDPRTSAHCPQYERNAACTLGREGGKEMTRHICGAMLVSASVAACASYSAYVPEERATTTLGGRTAAVYSLPSEGNPQGDLRVASYGISEITRNGKESGKAIHVRM